MGYRIGRKQRQLNKDTGFTLVELIVCFALLGIFMVCAMLIISSVMGIYYHAKGVDTGRRQTWWLPRWLARLREPLPVQM